MCEEDENKRVWSTSLCLNVPVSSRVSAWQARMVYADASMRATLQVCGVLCVSFGFRSVW